MTERRERRRWMTVLMLLGTTASTTTASSSTAAPAVRSLAEAMTSLSSDSSDMAPGGSEPLLLAEAEPVVSASSSSTDPWKAKEEWWKDPLSLFDDDDEFIGGGSIPPQGEEGSVVVEEPMIRALEELTQPGGDNVKSSSVRPPAADLELVEEEEESFEDSAGNQQVVVVESVGSGASLLAKTLSASVFGFLGTAQQWLGKFPIVQIVAGAAVAKAVWSLTQKLMEQQSQQGSQNVDVTDHTIDPDGDDTPPDRLASIVDEQEQLDLEELEDEVQLAAKDEATGEEQDRIRGGEHARQSSSSVPRSVAQMTTAPVGRSSSSQPATGTARSMSWLQRVLPTLGSGKPQPKLPPARQLYEQVVELQAALEAALSDKAVMEREYEQCSWELQERQTEIASLQSTTKYLQAQVRDQEEMLERVTKQERRKAKEELVRMKAAMVKVLEREREAMKDEFMKQASELQSLLQQEDDPQQMATSVRS